MGTLEIILLAAGAIIFIVSFCIPVKEEKLKEETKNLAAEEVRNLVTAELETVRGRLTELSEEEMKQQIEKSERSMERISNEKITAVSEFSDTVLEDIHKSHQEVMFLYDMLHDKQKNLLETAKEIERTRAIAKETKDELENTVQEAANVEALEAAATVKAAASEPAEVSGTDSDEGIKKETEAGEEINNNEKILEMHRQGRSNVAIAKELGLGVGEVNLVIGLFEVISS